MFEVSITTKDIEKIRDYMQNKGLITHMNDAGLSLTAMALMLDAIESKCDQVLKEMENN